MVSVPKAEGGCRANNPRQISSRPLYAPERRKSLFTTIFCFLRSSWLLSEFCESRGTPGHLRSSPIHTPEPNQRIQRRPRRWRGGRELDEAQPPCSSISVFKNSNLSIFILFTFDDRFDHFLNLSIVIVGPLLVSPFLEAAMIQFCIPPSR